MTSSEVWIIKTILGGIAALFGLLAAILAFLDTLHGDKQEPVRAWFSAGWQVIGGSRWMSMPEKVIGFLLSLQARLVETAVVLFNLKYSLEITWCLASFAVLVGLWLWIGTRIAIAALIVIVVGSIVLFTRECKFWHTGYTITHAILLLFVYLSFIGTLASGALGAIAWLCVSLRMPLPYTALTMLVLVPIYWILFIGPVVFVRLFVGHSSRAIKFTEHTLFFFFAVGLSFSVTYLSFLLGHIARPSAHVPQNLQMVTSNLFFDGCTMVATIIILRWAISKNAVLRIPLAVILDIIVAGTLACCSLYFGLVGSQNHLTLRQVQSVLIGRSPISSGWELGPYFWAMHTTFFPTAFYLFVILFCWLAKTILTVAHWFFQKGQEKKNPLKLTAAACGVMVAILSLAAYTAGVIEEHLKDKEKEVVKKVIQRKNNDVSMSNYTYGRAIGERNVLINE